MGLLDALDPVNKAIRGKKGGTFADPGNFGSSFKPEKPKKTAEMLAAEKRMQMALDKETEEEEARLKAAARGRLGSASLLGGQSKRGTSRSRTSTGTSGSGSSGSGTAGSLINRTGGPGSSRR